MPAASPSDRPVPPRVPLAEPPFRGVGVAIVTLFDDRGVVKAPATGNLAAELVDAGLRVEETGRVFTG